MPQPRHLSRALEAEADAELDSAITATTPPIIAFTGHRPQKLGGYSPEAQTKLVKFAEQSLASLRPARVISGFALGWDLAIAEAAIKLNIPLIAAIPFPNQPARWPSYSIAHWHLLKSQATEVKIISHTYSEWALQQRNQWMVDNAHKLVALWDGSPGGTKNCLIYGITKRIPITNLWPEWSKF